MWSPIPELILTLPIHTDNLTRKKLPFETNLKVLLWSKISFLCSLYNLKIQVLITYCAKSYVKTQKGGPIFSIVNFGLGWSPLLNSKMPAQSAETWIDALVTGRDVRLSTDQNKRGYFRTFQIARQSLSVWRYDRRPHVRPRSIRSWATVLRTA